MPRSRPKSPVSSCAVEKGTVPGPRHAAPAVSAFCEGLDATSPSGVFWVCGKRACTQLPTNRKGSHTVGHMQPGFFLLPDQGENELAVPLHKDLKARTQGSLEIGGQQTRGEDRRLPHCIIQYYCPQLGPKMGAGATGPLYTRLTGSLDYKRSLRS